MSGGLAPSKSTVYVSNLPFSLTNNDLHKIFEKYGKVVKVTIMSDKQTRQSKGVAFVLFLERESAYKCVRSVNQTKMFGRTIKCSIAKDNGRAQDFIRRKTYADKSRCYQCGEEGHLSYNCPKNLFGDREPPEKKKKKKKGEYGEEEEEYVDSDDEDTYNRQKEIESRLRQGNEGESSESEEGEDPAEDSLATAIRLQQEKMEEEEYRYKVSMGDYSQPSGSEESSKRKKYKKDGYFSDEEELEDD